MEESKLATPIGFVEKSITYHLQKEKKLQIESLLLDTEIQAILICKQTTDKMIEHLGNTEELVNISNSIVNSIERLQDKKKSIKEMASKIKEDMNYANLRHIVNSLRKEAGLSEIELSIKIGYSKDVITPLEKHGRLTEELLYRLCNHFGITVNWEVTQGVYSPITEDKC